MESETSQEHLHPEITIEIPHPGDAEAVRHIQAQTWYETYASPERGVTVEGLRRRQEGENGEKIEKKRTSWRERIETAGDDHAMFVAKDGGKIVGFVAASTIDGQRRIGALYVLPDAQGNRAGTGLLQKVLEWFGDEEDIYLHVAEGNDRTIEFYEKFGFAMTGKRFDDDGPADAQIPEFEMVRRAHS